MTRGIYDFLAESNRIERIYEVRDVDVLAHLMIMKAPELTIPMLRQYVKGIAGAELRDQPGMNITVIDAKTKEALFEPPPGGPGIHADLSALLKLINAGEIDPYEAHLRYETLHPFQDGNGRSGRSIWAWQIQRLGDNPYKLPFLPPSLLLRDVHEAPHMKVPTELPEKRACKHGRTLGQSQIPEGGWNGGVGHCKCCLSDYGFIDSGSYTRDIQEVTVNDKNLCGRCGGKPRRERSEHGRTVLFEPGSA